MADYKSIPIILPPQAAGAVASPAVWNVTALLAERGVAVGSGGAKIIRITPIVKGMSLSASSTTGHTWSITFNGGAALTHTKTGQASGTGSYYNHQFDATFHDSAGTGGTFSKAGSVMTLVGTGARFSRAMVGQTIVIAGATSSGNNGTFTITACPTPTSLSWTNASGVAEAFPGTYAAGQAESSWPALTTNPAVVATLSWTGGSTFADLGGMIWVTIEYDGASCPTHTRFLPIPQGNFAGASAWCNSSTYTQVGTCQQLTGVGAGVFGLRESNITIHQDYLLFTANIGGIPNSLAYGAPSIRIGGVTVTTFTSITVTSATSFEVNYLVASPSPSASATIEAKTGAGLGGNEFFFPGGHTTRLIVFTCDASSVDCTVVGQRYVGNGSGTLGYAETEAKIDTWDIFIPEVVTASGPQCFVTTIGDSGVMRLNARLASIDGVGAVITERTAQEQLLYRMDTTGVGHEVGFRLDADGGAGPSISLARGVNRFRIKQWASSTAPQVSESRRRGTLPSGMYTWCYNCATPAGGLAAISTIIFEGSQETDYISSPSEGARFMEWTAYPPTFNDAVNYVQAAGIRPYHYENTTAILSILVQARASVESIGSDQVPILNSHLYAGFQKVDTTIPIDTTDYYQRYPGEPAKLHGGLTPSRPRVRHFTCGNGSRVGVRDFWCIAKAIRTISVVVTGFTGDGSGITARIFRTDTGELAATLTTAIGGTATMSFLDDTVGGSLASTISLFGSASQGLLAGTSPTTAGSTITIPFPSPPPPPATAYDYGYD